MKSFSWALISVSSFILVSKLSSLKALAWETLSGSGVLIMNSLSRHFSLMTISRYLMNSCFNYSFLKGFWSILADLVIPVVYSIPLLTIFYVLLENIWWFSFNCCLTSDSNISSRTYFSWGSIYYRLPKTLSSLPFLEEASIRVRSIILFLLFLIWLTSSK